MLSCLSVSKQFSKLPSLSDVPYGIYAFHRYTINSAYLICTQVNQYQRQFNS